MKIAKKDKLIFSDTQIPDIFITEYMPELSNDALRIYLYFCLMAKEETSVTERDLSIRFSADSDSIKAAITELLSYQLLEPIQDGYIIADIKYIHAEKLFRHKAGKKPSDVVDGNGFSEKEKLVSDINKTFFSGVMSPSWYCEIDDWFENYGFEPHVVYALFNECVRRGKLNSKAYISKVAKNWSEIGIKSYEDLNRYFMSYDKVERISKKTGQKLRKSMTEYDREKVEFWVNKMGYDFDIIELALKKTSRLKNPNLDYANSILKDWFSHSLDTPEKIREYEKIKKQKFLTEKKGDNRNNSANVGNFEQREYSDEYIEQMIEDANKH